MRSSYTSCCNSTVMLPCRVGEEWYVKGSWQIKIHIVLYGRATVRRAVDNISCCRSTAMAAPLCTKLVCGTDTTT